jgi:hypothetical protein
MNNSPLLLLDDPLKSWGLSKQNLIDCYQNLIKSDYTHILGYKGNDGQFKSSLDEKMSQLKFVNFFSEVRNSAGSGIYRFYEEITKHKFTHDLLITYGKNPVIIEMCNNLCNIFKVSPNEITFNFIEANVTLLAHKDTDYFNKTENLPIPMLTMKNKMITDNALNWILVGHKSHFRLLADGKKYSNNGSDKVCFFDPCKYKHGTTLNNHRLILTVRFRTLKYNDIIPIVYNHFQVEEVTPTAKGKE